MLTKLTAIHIILVTFYVIGTTAHPIQQANIVADKRVMEFLLKLNFFDGAVKGDLSKFFTAYVTKMKESKRIYETAYGLCVGKADEDRQFLNYGMTVERNSFESVVNRIYENFVQCNINNASFIACYVYMAKDALKQFATAVNAPDNAITNINKEIEKINYEEERCKKQALHKYNADNEKIYYEFEEGLNKKITKKSIESPDTEETTTVLDISTKGLDEEEEECTTTEEPDCETTTTECIDPTTTTECIDPTTTECLDPTTTTECIDTTTEACGGKDKDECT